jgi:hypothetical protein
MKRIRSPAPNRSNKAGLPQDVQRLLLQAIRSNVTFKDFCSGRPDICKPHSSKSVENKFYSLKRLKDDKAEEFWVLVANKDEEEEEEEAEEEGEQEGEAEQEEESASDQIGSRHASWALNTMSKRSPARTSTPVKRYGATTAMITSPYRGDQGDDDSYDGNVSEDGKVESDPFCKLIVKRMFLSIVVLSFLLLTSSFIRSSVKDAMQVDLEFPEQNGSFFILETKNVLMSDGSVVDTIQVLVSGGIDMRDFPSYEATLVKGGRGLVIQVPSAPAWMYQDVETLSNAEKHSCPTMKQSHMVHANRMIQNEDRQLKTFTMYFPDGMCCSTDFSDNATRNPHANDQIAPPEVRCTKLEYTYSNVRAVDTLSYIYWRFRVLGINKSAVKRSNDTEVTALQKAMEGANVA